MTEDVPNPYLGETGEPRWHDLDFRFRGAIILSGFALGCVLLAVGILVFVKVTS